MGIPQGGILGSILFLIFINDSPAAIDLISFLFADDCTFQPGGPDLPDSIEKVNRELCKAQEWFASNQLTLNVSKTKYIIFARNPLPPQARLPAINIGQDKIARVGQNCML